MERLGLRACRFRTYIGQGIGLYLLQPSIRECWRIKATWARGSLGLIHTLEGDSYDRLGLCVYIYN